jgi:aspartate kinase
MFKVQIEIFENLQHSTTESDFAVHQVFTYVDAHESSRAGNTGNNLLVFRLRSRDAGPWSRRIVGVFDDHRDAGLLVTDNPGNARVLPESYKNLYALRDSKEVIIFPGFFGYTKEGQLLTFSRGGSDISGAIVANGVKASLYENFTDVDAIYVANPKMVKHPKKIKQLTYREMRELSYSGFSVFHDEALQPAFSAGIPVVVKNTNNPSAPGTSITRTKPENKQIVSGIASSTGFMSIYIGKYLMNREVGFGRRVLQIFEDFNLNFEHMPSGIDDLSIILRANQMTMQQEQELLYRLKNELEADDVHVKGGICLLMIVGEGMVNSVGTVAKACTALAEADINLEMINQGSSEVSIMFGIDEKDEARAVKVLYDAFFPQKD